jgi:thioredoxin-like negative regulator of GroEL
MKTPTDHPQLLCLCAAWCRLCDAYAPVFGDVARRLHEEWPELAVRWIDIEDEADLIGDLEVETFPTIVLLRGTQLVHFGPLPPQPEVLERVVRAALTSSDDAVSEACPEAAAFAGRLANASTARRSV